MQLYGEAWSRRDLEARMGRIEQIAGIRRWQLVQGREDGVELIQVRTGAGLTYYVSPARGLDISLAEFGGFPISWQSANGDVHPAYYDAGGLQWLRTAVGGLLMTCGLTQVGSPNVDQGEALGLHGRYHHLAAEQVSAVAQWNGDEYEMRIGGSIVETRIFGEHLRLTREIRSRLGRNSIYIQDQVENVGFESVPHMMLYHFNFGFPLLSPQTRLAFPSRRVIPREPETPLAGYDQWQAPTAGYRERVYYHEDLLVDNGWSSAVIENPEFPVATGGHCGLQVRLSWMTQNLPRLIEWKMPGMGVHVLGIEPANCYVEGRAKERERKTLIYIEPGQSLNYQLTLEIMVS